MASEPSAARTFSRWALPVVCFVVIVASIAWISQNLPKGTTTRPAVAPPTTNFVDNNRPSALQFLSTRAVWDANDPDRVREAEVGVEGFYDFAFLNPHPEPVTLGFARTSCDCSQLDVAILGPDWGDNLKSLHEKNPGILPSDPDWTWTTLPQSDKEGVAIPANGAGVARVRWNGRKAAGQRLRLAIKMWMAPALKPDDRSFETLDVPIVMSDPIRFESERIQLGVIGPGGEARGEFLLWSPTRDRFDLAVVAEKLPANLEARAVKLDDAERARLEKRLREQERPTKVLSGYRVEVVLREQRDGKQLDLGPFHRPVPLTTDLPVELTPPIVSAHVRGDIDVGLPEDGGAIHLKTFPAKDGVRKSIPIWADGAAELEIVERYPLSVEVSIRKNAKESTPARSKWSLDVVVPAGAWFGAFQDDAGVTLKTGSNPPRRIRIPIIGAGVQG